MTGTSSSSERSTTDSLEVLLVRARAASRNGNSRLAALATLAICFVQELHSEGCES